MSLRDSLPLDVTSNAEPRQDYRGLPVVPAGVRDIPAASGPSSEAPAHICDHRGRVYFPRNPDGPPHCLACYESGTDAIWAEWKRQQNHIGSRVQPKPGEFVS